MNFKASIICAILIIFIIIALAIAVLYVPDNSGNTYSLNDDQKIRAKEITFYPLKKAMYFSLPLTLFHPQVSQDLISSGPDRKIFKRLT